MLYLYRCKLDRVIDGDTVDAYIDLGFDVSVHKRIRLHGIDAPETRTRDLQEKARGMIAKARLMELLEDNNNRFLLQSVTVGKYGRCVGRLYTGDWSVQYAGGCKSINSILIEENLASPYEA